MGGWIVTIFDRQGVKLDEVDAKVNDVDWLLSQYGKATIELAITNKKNRRRLMEYGNRVLIETNADDAAGVDLPTWCGVIDPGRAWPYLGTTVTCYSADWLLYWRPGPKASMKKTGSWGDLFKWVLDEANALEDLFIRAGDIDTAGSDVSRSLEGQYAYDVIQGIVKDSKFDYVFEPGYDLGGKLLFNANFKKEIGGTSTFILREGDFELSSQQLNEEGPLYNRIEAFWTGGVDDGTTYTATAEDQDSISRFGLRVKRYQPDGSYHTKSSVEEAARAELARYAWPLYMPEISVVKPDVMKEIKLGWKYPIEFTTAGYYSDAEFGWKGTVRVVGMNYDGKVLRLHIEGRDDE